MYLNILIGDVLARMRIENAVASTALRRDLDLQTIALSLDNAEYEPEKFPSLIYQLEESKAVILLFRSSEAVCTAASVIKDVRVAICKVAKQIETMGIEIELDPLIIVQNIVASSDLEQEAHLNVIDISLCLERVEYGPGQFPRLAYRFDDPKIVLLIFRSGRLVYTGAKKPHMIIDAANRLQKSLEWLD
ncbi:MAG: TATA-box-binding protein [Euryarchaeota archaeon]|nr:TATA-box-binding protein [Euryarchaeota archaeon]